MKEWLCKVLEKRMIGEDKGRSKDLKENLEVQLNKKTKLQRVISDFWPTERDDIEMIEMVTKGRA